MVIRAEFLTISKKAQKLIFYHHFYCFQSRLLKYEKRTDLVASSLIHTINQKMVAAPKQDFTHLFLKISVRTWSFKKSRLLFQYRVQNAKISLMLLPSIMDSKNLNTLRKLLTKMERS